MSDKAIMNLYQTKPTATVKNNSPRSYFLVKFKKPADINAQKTRLLKRVSYNFYVVEAPGKIVTGENIESAIPANSLWKASDNLLQLWQKHPNGNQAIELAVTSSKDSILTDLKKYGDVTVKQANMVTVNISMQLLPELLDQPYVVFANTVRQAHEELIINDIDLGLNNISAISNNYPGIDGAGINVDVKEQRYDDDLDLLGRSFSSFQAAKITSGHATIMATLIGGNGNSFIKGLGAAPKVRFTSSDFARLLPDSTAVFKAFN
ncbi:MAG: hypothetical protein AAGC65_11510, partial [Mucilaginibacter sp.]|uniref:hypothetical protein n=1 Tax=Mucilaginibacter sp. TaxID=1882438 RepID=UPI0031B12639